MSRADELGRALQSLLSDVALMTEDERERYMGDSLGSVDGKEALLLELRLMKKKIDQLEERM